MTFFFYGHLHSIPLYSRYVKIEFEHIASMEDTVVQISYFWLVYTLLEFFYFGTRRQCCNLNRKYEDYAVIYDVFSTGYFPTKKKSPYY